MATASPRRPNQSPSTEVIAAGMTVAFEPPERDPVRGPSARAAAGEPAAAGSGRPAAPRPRPTGSARLAPLAATTPSPSAAADPVAGADALRRLAADVSGKLDLESLFADAVANTIGLFSLSRIGLWLYDARRTHPFSLAAQQGLSEEIQDWVASLTADAPAAGLKAIRERRVVTVRDVSADMSGSIRANYLRNGIRSICLAPLIYRDEPVGLFVLYHDEVHEWTADEAALARGVADQMATAVGSDRLHGSVRSLAARLEAVQDLAVRLNRTRTLTEVADLVVEGTKRLIDHDSIRLYRIDHETGWCEPIAFQGTILGLAEPDPELLRVRIGEGLTGWAAEHNETVLLGDVGSDPRSLPRFRTSTIESILAVPISFEDQVHGVIVLSASGRNRFGPEDETTLSIFAGHAAQAIVNAAQMEQLHRQRRELEHQLASQRRLLEVNERLISTRDPKGVLEMIADSLKSLVPYDSLTIYRCDFAAGVRRAVVARDRFADVILDYAGPIEVGITGWVIAHGEGVLSNEAHTDSRSIQIPGTPFEPESMIVVPVRVGGQVVGTLNVGRMGSDEAHFSQNEFELVQLFAGQASLALENAEVHGAITVRAEHDSLTGLRNHGSFQRELGQAVTSAEGAPFALLMLDLDSFKGFNDTCGHPAGDALLAAIGEAMRSATRAGDQLYRYGGDEFAVILPGATRIDAFEVVERIRHAVAAIPSPTGPRVTISAGVACHPDDGRTKDELVAAADASL